MALTVEDGTIIENADSYISLEDARALACKWGIDLPVNDLDAEVALRQGGAYIDMLEPSISGYRTDVSQSMTWPRTYACKYNIDVASDDIPNDIKLAQVTAAVTYGEGVDVRPLSDGLSIQSEEIAGAIKTSYFQNGKSSETIEITEAVDLMQPYFSSGANSISFEVSR